MKEDVIVAGYICLDLLPELYPGKDGASFQYVPGKLLEVGGTDTCCGGAVPNTGLALFRLGHGPQLIGRIGNDAFGSAIRDLIERVQPGLGRHLIVDSTRYTANTFIINPPGQDRMFLVHTGANAGFSSRDLAATSWDGVRLFHFGYPPLVRESYRNNGNDTKAMFREMRRNGITTSLDMSLPDAGSEAARIDWPAWLNNVLPEVDVFLPSIEELAMMTGHDQATLLASPDALRALADELLAKDVAAVVIKLGSRGIYVRTTADSARLAGMGACRPKNPAIWRDQEYFMPCFKVDVKGTTGAGDCTIAGFLSGLLRGLSAVDSGVLACAVGACNVEAPDAFSGLQDFATVQRRLQTGWERRDPQLDRAVWQEQSSGVYSRKNQ